MSNTTKLVFVVSIELRERINTKSYTNVCQRCAMSNSEVTNSRQFPKAKICQRNAKICQRQLPKALGPLAVKAVTAVKALQLLHDLYKLSQLRLAVTAVKAFQLLQDIYKLS